MTTSIDPNIIQGGGGPNTEVPAFPSMPCSALNDDTVHAYTDLESDFRMPKDCLESTYTLAPDGYDYTSLMANSLATFEIPFFVSTVFMTSIRPSSTMLVAWRGRNPTCFPPHYPPMCSFMETVTETLGPGVDGYTTITVAQPASSETNYVYSPGRCPEGYPLATSWFETEGVSVTSALCCPSGYTVPPNYSSTDTMCETHTSTAVVINGATTTTSEGNWTLRAPTIRVAWQTSDLYRWWLAANATTSTNSFDVASTSSPTASISGSTDTPTADQASPRLSTGAKAGIGTGVAVVGLMIAAIVLFFSRRRNRKTQNDSEEKTDAFTKSELPGESKKQAEIAGENVYEAEQQQKPNEADNRNTRAELEGDWTGWEAPALLEVELSREGPGTSLTPGNRLRNSIQQTPVEMTARQ